MKPLAVRRWRNVILLLIVAAVAVVLERAFALGLRNVVSVTGWSLLGMVVFLALYNLRKRFPFLPLGSSTAWLQWHIYVGLAAILAFGMHVGWRVPNGAFEAVLALLFVLVAGSGVVGLLISRLFALRLASRGLEVTFDRIGRLRSAIRREVERLVVTCLTETESTAVPEFYLSRLERFFARPRNLVYHVVQSSRPRRRLLGAIEAQDRYLNAAERQVMRQVADRVMAKDDLDYQYAHQAALRYWLFLHVPLTYALLVFAAMHVILVYAF